MTGIERLRALIKDCRAGDECRSIACGDLPCGPCMAENLLEPIADQIEREQVEAAADHAIVASVVSEMERLLIGQEVRGNNPVARWARELREALGGEGRNPASDVSVSDYDLLPQEDREAITWVRAHGGLGAVTIERSNLWGTVNETRRRLGVDRAGDLTADAQAIWRKVDRLKSLLGDSVPRAAYERHLERRQRQVDESHAALRRRNGRIAELERERDGLRTRVENQRSSLDGLVAVIDEMRPRLIPEGMEWPRFEDGEPVRLGDDVICDGRCSPAEVNSIEFCHDMIKLYDCQGLLIAGARLSYGERVKRPAPKVLDADGVEVEVGDDLYSVEGMIKFHVSAIDRKNSRIATEAMFALDKWADPKMYTHRAPVLAADGKPLSEGETVYHIADGRACVVREVREGGAVVEPVDGRPCGRCRAEYLTHERPDSWERLEEDANAAVCVYFGASVKDCESCDHNSWECSYDKARDLVRRAKALAGGE